MTIKNLKEFLAKLPEEFDGFPLVFREVTEMKMEDSENEALKELGISDVDDEYIIAHDSPIYGAYVDEQTEEFCLIQESSADVIDRNTKES